MTGHCAQCREEREVARYRIAGLGLRYLDADCARWMHAVGMWLTPVTNADPRRGERVRRRIWSESLRRVLTGRRTVAA